MIRVKFIIVITIGIISLLYNFINNELLLYLNNESFLKLLSGQLAINTNDNILGIFFDLLLSFLFNINLKDITTFLKMFGG